MLFDEYINEHITLAWVTMDVAKATQVMLQFEERQVPYNLVKKDGRWVFTFHTTNGKAMELISVVLETPVPGSIELGKFSSPKREE